jgi:M6 family metalloprotease-like protein
MQFLVGHLCHSRLFSLFFSFQAQQVSKLSLRSEVKNLVILIRFADHKSRTLPTPTDYHTFFNSNTAHKTLCPTGSIRSFYLENSYGKLNISSTIVGWIDVDMTEQEVAANKAGLTQLTHKLIEKALNIVDTTVDFSSYDDDEDGRIDIVTFLHSGYGAEFDGSQTRIW